MASVPMHAMPLCHDPGLLNVQQHARPAVALISTAHCAGQLYGASDQLSRACAQAVAAHQLMHTRLRHRAQHAVLLHRPSTAPTMHIWMHAAAASALAAIRLPIHPCTHARVARCLRLTHHQRLPSLGRPGRLLPGLSVIALRLSPAEPPSAAHSLRTHTCSASALPDPPPLAPAAMPCHAMTCPAHTLAWSSSPFSACSQGPMQRHAGGTLAGARAHAHGLPHPPTTGKRCLARPSSSCMRVCVHACRIANKELIRAPPMSNALPRRVHALNFKPPTHPPPHPPPHPPGMCGSRLVRLRSLLRRSACRP